MTGFVLVAGAWLGPWAWDEVTPRLRAAGHGAPPVDADRPRGQAGCAAGQQTHVRDIVDEVERQDLRNVVLVGHSYSGIPVGQAAGRIGDRLARIIFVDANVPTDGESFVSAWWEGPAKLEAALAANGGFWAPRTAPDLRGPGPHRRTDRTDRGRFDAAPGCRSGRTGRADKATWRTPGDVHQVSARRRAEPGYDVAELLTSDQWRLVEMDTGHWPMFSRPGELARIFLDAVGD
ncbi:alpha/beta fold hydrolase [Streptomyces sp. NPDC055287]